MLHLKNAVSIVLAGEAGQGIQSIESILANVLKKDGYHVFSTKEYMSRVRGGINSTEIRVSSDRVDAYVEAIDILIALDQAGIPHLSSRMSDQTLVIGEKDKIQFSRLIDVPLTKTANDIGNVIFSNTVAVGLICGLLKVNQEMLFKVIEQQFAAKSDEIKVGNVEAAKRGMAIALDIFSQLVQIDIKKNDSVREELMFSGADAVALGAVAGGCDYICAYPMSPGTGVLTSMASYSKELDIIVEQVEDEIGVINMALGAWYAGAKAMVTTSGGGFALMTEGFSLSGMIESPLVVHIGQRPGPATGLPTRTEQGDFNLALYAGHGEFPRAIYAPGTLDEAFHITRQAFQTADQFQVPAVILTDQYFVDSYYNTPMPDLKDLRNESRVVKSSKDYQRFRLTDDGISPRSIPGFGEGFVKVDSDEHDEMGHITEDLDIRNRMADKRMSKLKLLEDSALPPTLIGDEHYHTLILCWGSPFGIIREAMERLAIQGLAMLHFSQVFPLHSGTAELLSKADKLIIIENNETGQFGSFVESQTGVVIDMKILKYNGLPFSVEEVMDAILKNSKGEVNG